MNFLKTLIYTVIAGTLLPAMTSCELDFDHREEPGPTIEGAHRSILVYMVASNSLGTGRFDTADIDEMKTFARDNAGWLGNGRLLVYRQPYKYVQNSSGGNVLSADEPQLFEIMPHTGDTNVIKSYGNDVSSVSEARMREVIADFKAAAPNDEYGLVLWSHSDAWRVHSSSPDPAPTSTLSRSVMPLAFGQETVSGTSYFMNIPTLAGVLTGQDFEFVYFDCCYMASVEVFYEMRNVAPYIVGSAIEVIGEGMPYQLSLPHLFDTDSDYLQHAVEAVYEYVDAKTDENRSGTYSVVDMSKIDRVAAAARAFYSLKPLAPRGFTPQKYMYQNPCYFFDFQHIIENLELPADSDDSFATEFEAKRREVIDAIEDAVVYKANTPYMWPGYYSIPLDHHSGMSSYYLTSLSQASTQGYNTTAWWKEVGRYQFED